MSLLLFLTPFTAIASDAPYEISSEVVLTAAFDDTVRDAAIYSGRLPDLNLDEAALTLGFDASGAIDVKDFGNQITWDNGMEKLIVYDYSAETLQNTHSISYNKVDQTNKYTMLLDYSARYLSGITAPSELSFMSSADAVAQCTALLKELCAGVEPVCTDVCGFTVDELDTIRGYLLENDDMYATFAESGKVAASYEFTAADEVYTLKFIFQLDGLPVYNNEEPALSIYSENERAAADQMYCNIVLGQEGILNFTLENCAQVEGELERGQVIPALDAAKVAAERYADVIMDGRIAFTEVYLEYLPLIQADGSLRFTPAWCMVAAMEGAQQYPIEACRINALTGEVIN